MRPLPIKVHITLPSFAGVVVTQKQTARSRIDNIKASLVLKAMVLTKCLSRNHL